MGFFDGFKTLRDMAAEYKNAELNKKILDLQSDMFELVEENQSLKQEIESFKKQISLSEKLSFQSPFWYMEGDSQPYCPRCKESDNN